MQNICNVSTHAHYLILLCNQIQMVRIRTTRMLVSHDHISVNFLFWLRSMSIHDNIMGRGRG